MPYSIENANICIYMRSVMVNVKAEKLFKQILNVFGPKQQKNDEFAECLKKTRGGTRHDQIERMEQVTNVNGYSTHLSFISLSCSISDNWAKQ